MDTELPDVLTMAERACREAREYLTLGTFMAERAKEPSSRLAIAGGINGNGHAATSSESDRLRTTSQQLSKVGLANLGDAVKFARMIVELGVPLLKEHGINV